MRSKPDKIRQFLSSSAKGQKEPSEKSFSFNPLRNPNLYNLAFGDRDPLTGGVNDMAVSNNGDTDKVLATVAAALYAFCERFRTLLYMQQAAL